MKIGGFFKLASLGQTVAEAFILKKFLTAAAMLLLLTIVVSIVIGGLVLAMLWGVFLVLMEHGYTQIDALWLVIVGAALAVTILVGSIIATIRSQMRFGHYMDKAETKIGKRFMPVVDAFMDGLMTPTPAEDLSKK
jgi:D-alanyl-lipoteichoic acid acyltransferase DltB (MBOAT superfamily)